MIKFELKVFLKAPYEPILAFLQIFIMFLPFFKWKLLPKKQIFQFNPIFNFMGILITLNDFIIKFRIVLEEQFLTNKFKNYLRYKNDVKY